MSEPFVGEIKMAGFGFAPQGWATCNGQLLSIQDHFTLYALISTTFGGDGQTTFALPDMRGRVPVHQSWGYYRGQQGGIERVPLHQTQLPIHSHTVKGATATGDVAEGSTTRGFAVSSGGSGIYGDATGLVNMEDGVVDPCEGGGLGHNNVQPSLVINFLIAMDGQFPMRS